MGTRNLTMVISNGETKVAQYGQWDGYPEGQGQTILKFLLSLDKEGFEKFKERVNQLRWHTKEEEAKMEAMSSEEWLEKYPYLSRDVGGKILEAIFYNKITVGSQFLGNAREISVNVESLTNSEDFAEDSLFCEWAYVIDLDKNTFEVYEGFNKEPLAETERFYRKFFKLTEEDKYYPVRLKKFYWLDKLPTYQEFISDLTEPVEEDGQSDNDTVTLD